MKTMKKKNKFVTEILKIYLTRLSGKYVTKPHSKIALILQQKKLYFMWMEAQDISFVDYTYIVRTGTIICLVEY